MRYEVVITIGGVSKGKKDYFPEVYRELGINHLFHGVNQSPGKPMLFARTNNNTIFGLPGNPISSYLCFHHYILGWIRHYLPTKNIAYSKVKITKKINLNNDMHRFILVKSNCKEGDSIDACPINMNNSGDIVALSKADGYISTKREEKYFIDIDEQVDFYKF